MEDKRGKKKQPFFRLLKSRFFALVIAESGFVSYCTHIVLVVLGRGRDVARGKGRRVWGGEEGLGGSGSDGRRFD